MVTWEELQASSMRRPGIWSIGPSQVSSAEPGSVSEADVAPASKAGVARPEPWAVPVPGATPTIAYQMPAFRSGRVFVELKIVEGLDVEAVDDRALPPQVARVGDSHPHTQADAGAGRQPLSAGRTSVPKASMKPACSWPTKWR